MQIKELTKEEKMTISAALKVLQVLSQGYYKGNDEVWVVKKLIDSGLTKQEIAEICGSLLERLIKK